MTERPPITWSHGGMTLLAMLAFAVAGLVVSMTIKFMFDVGWIIIYLLWPFLLAQLVLSLFFEGVYALFRSILGKPTPTEQAPLVAAQKVPWLRENSGWIGFFLGVSYTAILELNASWT